MRRLLGGCALALGLVAGCAGEGPSSSTEASARGSATPSTPASTPPSTPTRAPSAAASAFPTATAGAGGRSRPRLDSWRVGARPLPLRDDGFGQVLPTPAQLRVRRMPTADLLAPPRRGRYAATVAPVTPQVRRRMGETWSPACPVPLSELRYLTVAFRGFDGRPHTGELVVAAAVAEDVVEVFGRLFAASYPIEEMRLPTTADLDAPPTGDGNNTAAYVCRPVRGSSVLSAHAYGLAVDVNPFLNPYRKGDLVLPELASAYLDRTWRRPGMVLRGDVVTRAFARVGWTWGGDFDSVWDPMHFSANGR